LNGTHQLLLFIVHTNMLGENINSTENAEALLGVSMEIGLEVNTEKAKYLAVSPPECRTKS